MCVCLFCVFYNYSIIAQEDLGVFYKEFAICSEWKECGRLEINLKPSAHGQGGSRLASC
jgi:hypothetical protein